MREAPPAAHTGGFGEPTCHACHFQAPVNSGTGAVRLLGLPGAWEPGAAYTVTVELQHAGMIVGGFQLAARFDDASQAGSLAPDATDDPRVRVADFQDVQYAHQTWDGAEPREPGTVRWTLLWTAPHHGGTITFHVAANAANDDDSPLGDFIYTAEHTLPPASVAKPQTR